MRSLENAARRIRELILPLITDVTRLPGDAGTSSVYEGGL